LFAALAWQVFAPVFDGATPAEPDPLFWWGFGLGTFFLAFGLSARQHLTDALRQFAAARKR
jgi:hypothetical protein